MAEVYFLRHAESQENVGCDCTDAPLTALGRDQAGKVAGNYDLVICSPMRRCLETLHCSRVTYKDFLINENLRERIWGPGSHKLFESSDNESLDKFYARCTAFTEYLEKLLPSDAKLDKPYRILIVGHGLFYLSWREKTDTAEILSNAQLVRILL